MTTPNKLRTSTASKATARSLAVSAPVVQPGSTRKSNLDLTGMRLVKKGVVVSWHGIRFTVCKVRMGICYPDPIARMHTKWFDCESVQVVA